MKWEFRYPLYIRGICHTYTATVHIHGIYMVYTDYIPRRGSRRWRHTLVLPYAESLLPPVARGWTEGSARCASDASGAAHTCASSVCCQARTPIARGGEGAGGPGEGAGGVRVVLPICQCVGGAPGSSWRHARSPEAC
jgi:hypothetical protein